VCKDFNCSTGWQQLICISDLRKWLLPFSSSMLPLQKNGLLHCSSSAHVIHKAWLALPLPTDARNYLLRVGQKPKRV
jgi:hypothetical protein